MPCAGAPHAARARHGEGTQLAFTYVEGDDVSLTRTTTVRWLIACAMSAGIGLAQVGAVQQPKSPVNPKREAPAEFKTRVDDYMALHKKLEATLPKLPREATPTQIDGDQRALAKLIAEARSTSKPGDIFTPGMQVFTRDLLERLFVVADRKILRASIMDENPGPITLKVNGRYPDTVPLATMPPEVLASLPKLPEELEYRFVGDALILLDAHAHIVADFFPRVLPK
jgi:hypothetical protein